MRKKSLALLLLICLACTSCATWNLPKDASDAQKHLAHCTDAQTAYEVSVAALDGSVSGALRVYWEAYKLGAQIFLTRYCPVDID